MNEEGMYGGKQFPVDEGLGKFGDVSSGGGQEGHATAGSS